MPNLSVLLAVILMCLSFGSVNAHAEQPHIEPIQEIVDSTLKSYFQNDAIVTAIAERNTVTRSYNADDIQKYEDMWNDQLDSANRPLISKVLNHDISRMLRDLVASGEGLFTEVILMDNKGLNVATSDITSDYWQGDEAKYQKTFLLGSDAVFIDEIEMDESSQQLQSQVSFTISDPVSGEPIGAVTVGIGLDAL